MNQNWLDKAIAWVSPAAGLKRVRARALASTILSYDAVRSDRRQGGRSASGTSGNAEIGPNQYRIRANARDLCRNNAHAGKAKREWAKRVVGTGITPRPNTGEKNLDQLILDYWNRWVRRCCSDQRLNFYALQQMMVGARYESGEILVRFWNRLPEDGLEVPFQIQVLEGDYLDTDKTQPTNTGYIINGVEFDKIGRIRGYWLWSQHPGEVGLTGAYSGLQSRFVSANKILHHAEFDRPGDARSVSRLASIMAKLQDIGEYSDAEIVRKKIEACLTAFYTHPEGDTLAGDGISQDASGNYIEELSPGTIHHGKPGAEVKFFEPTSSGDYSAFKKSELREVAVGSDVPYVILDDNLEAVNYSSYRGGMLSFRDSIDQYRWNWFIPQVLDPTYSKFIETLSLKLGMPGIPDTVNWDPPQFDVLDRGAEAEADQLELQIGKTTWPQLVARSGYDPDEQIKEIEKYKPLLDSAGVRFSKDTPDPDQAGGEDDDIKAARP